MLKLEKPLCFYFAKGGHLDLAIKVPLFDLQSPSWSYFLSVALQISETNPSVEDMNEILMAGCIGGHKDVILYALENGARPNIFWDVSLIGPSLGCPALFDLLLEHFPDYLSNEINRIKVLSFKYPCVPLVKWLIGKGIAFSDLDVHRLFAANYFGLDLPSEALMKVMEETKENRFECMKYLSENAGKTWETGFLFEMARWASLKEMSWVFHRCTGMLLIRTRLSKTIYVIFAFVDISPKGAPYRFPVGVMDRFLSSRNRVDLGLLEFLLFKVGCPIAGVDLFLICFADNNLEALHFLDDNYFSKKENLPMVSDQINFPIILSTVVDVFSRLTQGKADELKRLTPEKSRIRMGNMLQVIRWFCFHKVPLAKAVIGTLKTVINLYFQRELEKILSEYWELVVL